MNEFYYNDASDNRINRSNTEMRKNIMDLTTDLEDCDANYYTNILGYLLLITTYFIFLISMYAIVVSKWMPITGNKILDWIAQDTYYCYFIPMIIPVFLLTVIINWLGMKFFRQN